MMRKPLHRMSQRVASKCWQQVAPISKSQISSRQSRKSSSPLYNIGLEVSSTCCETTIHKIGPCSRLCGCQSPKFFSLQHYQRRFSYCACQPQRGMIWMFTIMANAMLTVTVTVMAIMIAILIMMTT